MDRGALLIAVIGSAGVGALVSSIITEIGRWRERKSRREELALAKAVEMAHAWTQTMLQLFKDTDRGGRLPPEALMAHDYYISLRHLLDEGKLDPVMWSRVESSMKKYGIDINKRDDQKL